MFEMFSRYGQMPVLKYVGTVSLVRISMDPLRVYLILAWTFIPSFVIGCLFYIYGSLKPLTCKTEKSDIYENDKQTIKTF